MNAERFKDEATGKITWVVRPKEGDSLSEWLMDLDEGECRVDFPVGMLKFTKESDRLYWADGYSIGEKRAEGLLTALTLIEGFLTQETPEARADRKADFKKAIDGVPEDCRQRVAEIIERISSSS